MNEADQQINGVHSNYNVVQAMAMRMTGWMDEADRGISEVPSIGSNYREICNRVVRLVSVCVSVCVSVMECVASSISRWLGCKAEYYLLSCSTHSI